MEKNTSPFIYDVVEENTGFLLWQVAHMWQQKQEKVLKKNFGISQSQYVILASVYWLNVHKKEVTQAYLSQHTKIDKMTVSKILEILEEKAYICRKPHSSDMRANCVCLTSPGKKFMSKAIDVIESIDKNFFIPLDEDTKSFNIALLKIINNESQNPNVNETNNNKSKNKKIDKHKIEKESLDSDSFH